MMPNYPCGIDLVQVGGCPLNASGPMACMFCSCGHMLECHYPYDCVEANCGHYQAEAALDPYMVPDPDWDETDPACEICGCTEYNACPGGCAWSKRYPQRAICTSCEPLLIMFENNMAMLRIYQLNAFQNHMPNRRPERNEDSRG